MSAIDDDLRRGPTRPRTRPVCDALSVSAALVTASRHVIDRSRARAVEAETLLARRLAEALAALGAAPGDGAA